MKRIHIIGRKNHGKTTLVVELVSALTASGLKVGTIKHTHHNHDLDVPGKDSHRHRTAGAIISGICSPQAGAIFFQPPPLEDDATNDAKYAVFQPHFQSCDVVIVEGDTHTAAPKLEVWRASVGGEPYATSDCQVHAIISDDPSSLGNIGDTPVWSRSNVADLLQRLLLLLKQ